MTTPHNPHNLTGDQIEVADGWRLLDLGEYLEEQVLTKFGMLQQWQIVTSKWDDGSFFGSNTLYTYRTKLSRAELRAARGLPTEILYSGFDGSAVTGSGITCKVSKVVTAAEVIQSMRLVGTQKMREQLEKMESDNPMFLIRLRDLFALCRRDNEEENQ